MKRIKFVSAFTVILLFLFVQVFSQPLETEHFKNMKARCIGPAGMSGRVTAIDAVVSNPGIIYLKFLKNGL